MNRSVFRIIDANFNRAREALRVLEEHARMILDDADLSRRIKTCRHDLSEAISLFDAGELLASRDVAGDVGTRISTPREYTRESTEAVAIAAAKRAGESLRVIEEYGKTLDASVAAKIEGLRYSVYSIEEAVFIGGPRRVLLRQARLHVLITESLCRGDWIGVARAALRGGADGLQLREKNLSDRELLDRARQLRMLTKEHGGLLIINDRAEIAALADADGVHLGLDDLSVADARLLMGPHRLIGATAHSVEEARKASAEGPDYLGIGPMFASPTKPLVAVNGPALLHKICEDFSGLGISMPLVAIGGIAASNIAELQREGIRGRCSVGIAVCHAVIASEGPEEAARQLKSGLSIRE